MIRFLPRPLFMLVPIVVLLGGCSDVAQSDAFGNFEATEITVSAQADGLLLSLEIEEGDQVTINQVAATIDSTQLDAQFDALVAQIRQLEAQQAALAAQEEAARLQARIANPEQR